MDTRRQPVYSSLDDDASLRDEIDDFVVHLAERVDELQDAEGDGAFGELEALCRKLADQARHLGYEPLREICLQAADAGAERKAESAQAAVVEITELCRRIRMGHRGSA